ncbi:MAG: AAA family ATPase [Desulfobacteraceae bacterium]|jgi:general secretion pathway protein A
MDYFSVLNLNKEPFSNSPDPEFFYHSREHVDCLQKLELSLLLRRGLNVIIGDVGTGKTTLCRQLIRRFSKREDVDTHLILDPHFVDANEFLLTVAKMFSNKVPAKSNNNWQIKEYIKQYLYRSGVEQEKTTILIIDEGQKIPAFCLEILREFLNYETNEFKLLQIVIFAQLEFEKIIQKHPNFADRINLYHYLKPLNFRETRSMIKFRLEQSRASGKRLELFSLAGLMAIYRFSDGYPRKVINLCHQSILTMIIQNRNSIGYFLVRSCVQRVFPTDSGRWKKVTATAAIFAGLIAILLVLTTSNPLKAYLPWDLDQIKAVVLPEEKPVQNSPEPEVPVASAQLPAVVLQPAVPVEPVPLPEPETVIENPVPAVQEPAAAEIETIETAAVQPEVVEDAPEPRVQTTYAELLGDITVQRNETLSRIIQKVYGSYNSKYFRLLILANPMIDDPDRVDIGQAISLPAIPARVRPRSQKAWWVQVKETDSLEEAFNVLRSYPEQGPPVRLIPYWTSEAGMIFAVVMKEYFSNPIAADHQLDQLPLEFAAQGKVISLWNEEAVFFADPFLKRRK